jgi:hypothetical protein
MDHVRLHSTRTQPTCQPKAIAAGFEGKRNPRDLFTGPDCLIAPAMQQVKQPFGTRLQLLARLANLLRADPEPDHRFDVLALHLGGLEGFSSHTLRISRRFSRRARQRWAMSASRSEVKNACRSSAQQIRAIASSIICAPAAITSAEMQQGHPAPRHHPDPRDRGLAQWRLPGSVL